MPSRVVRPETKTLSISDGDWLLVKKRLSHGDQQEAFAHKYISDVFGQRVNLRLVRMDKVTAYLLDWSLTGLDEKPLVIKGQPIEVVESALTLIDPESFDEIHAAIEAHEQAMATERANAKKNMAGATASGAISPSPSEPAGPSTRSEPST